MPWSLISSVPQSNAQRPLPYSINHRNVTAPQTNMTEEEMGCFHFTLCFCQGSRSHEQGEEDSRATYTHTPPVSTGKCPSAIQHSLVFQVRRWGTLGSAPGSRPHRWHCTGSRAATGSTFLQIHKLTPMRNVSASLPLKTQPFVFFLRKTAINNQTMQTARPKKQAGHPGMSQSFHLLFSFFSPQCQPETPWSVNRQAGSAWNNSKRKWIHRSLKWAGNLFINPIPAWQTVHLQQDNVIDLSRLTADLYDCDRMISLQSLMKWHHWFTLHFLLSTQACYWIIHLTAYRSLLFYCLWLGN